MRTGRPVSRGALYLTLERLVEKGYPNGRMADASRTRGNRPRKYDKVQRARQCRYRHDAGAAVYVVVFSFDSGCLDGNSEPSTCWKA